MFIKFKISANTRVIPAYVEKILDNVYETHYAEWVQYIDENVKLGLIEQSAFIQEDLFKRHIIYYFKIKNEEVFTSFQQFTQNIIDRVDDSRLSFKISLVESMETTPGFKITEMIIGSIDNEASADTNTISSTQETQ